MRSLLYIFFLSLTVFLTSGLQAQNYEEEIGFTFVKAKYLFDTERYDDAIREFNRVISKNPSLEDALVYRARAKYKLAAYVGTKKDILTYIELKGITPESVSLLAKAEYQLSEFDAALNSLTTALLITKSDVDLYEFRASILMDRDNRLQACQDWEEAAKLGSSRAVLAAKRNCGIDLEPMDREYANQESPPPVKDTDNADTAVLASAEEKDLDSVSNIDSISNPSSSQGEQEVVNREDSKPAESTVQADNDSNANQTIDSTSSVTEVLPEPKPYIDPRLLDDTENSIEIDEDLTLLITGQGLGSRELLRKPNILILSDEEGKVVIDVCVSRGGRVISAQYDQKTSTLSRKSLVSLALRKSKDFWFDKSDLIEQCGQIIFQVKGV